MKILLSANTSTMERFEGVRILSPSDLPIYDIEVSTALELSEWLRTGPVGAIGDANHGGWICYADSSTSEIPLGGRYFNGAENQTTGMMIYSDPRTSSTATGYAVVDSTTILFGTGATWTNVVARVPRGSAPIFKAFDSRGSFTCARTIGEPR